MEGPNLRSFPRTLLCCPVELQMGKKKIRIEQAVGNFSPRGLFLHHAEELPVSSAVHVKIVAGRPFELDGLVRFCGAEGIGIEFKAIDEVSRLRLDDLIAEFTPREILAS